MERTYVRDSKQPGSSIWIYTGTNVWIERLACLLCCESVRIARASTAAPRDLTPMKSKAKPTRSVCCPHCNHRVCLSPTPVHPPSTCYLPNIYLSSDNKHWPTADPDEVIWHSCAMPFRFTGKNIQIKSTQTSTILWAGLQQEFAPLHVVLSPFRHTKLTTKEFFGDHTVIL